MVDLYSGILAILYSGKPFWPECYKPPSLILDRSAAVVVDVRDHLLDLLLLGLEAERAHSHFELLRIDVS